MIGLPIAGGPADELAAQCVSCAAELGLANQSDRSRVLCRSCEDGLFGRPTAILSVEVPRVRQLTVEIRKEAWTPGELRRGSAFLLLLCIAVSLWFLSIVSLAASSWFVPLIALDWTLFLAVFLQEARRAQLSWEAERAAASLSEDVLQELAY